MNDMKEEMAENNATCAFLPRARAPVQAFETYFDRDHSDTLSAEEYASFYPKLMRLLEEDEQSLSLLTQEEREEMMKRDFAADAGEDGEVDKVSQIKARII